MGYLKSYQQGTVQTTTCGKVEGSCSADGSALLWQGIPYAKPAVGALRWMPPQDFPAWEGIRPAIAPPPKAIQKNALTGVISGQEDCFYLNLFRPNTAQTGLPVLVMLHGGNNQNGSSETFRSVSLPVHENCILISVHHRLGFFGSINLPALKTGTDPLADSGNFVLLDIAKALDWVAENVEAFGGDPHRVTLGGYSAGGRNTMAALISPLFRGKFQQAVSLDGGMTTADPQEGQQFAAKAFARLALEDGKQPTEQAALDWIQSDAAEVREYLYGLKAERIANLMQGAAIRMSCFPHLFADGVVLPKEGFACYQQGAEKQDVPLFLLCDQTEFAFFARRDPYFSCHSKAELLHDPKLHAEYAYSVKYGSLFYAAANAQFSAETIDGHAQSPIYVAQFRWGTNPDVCGEEHAFLVGAAHGIQNDFLFGTESYQTRTEFPEAYQGKAGMASLSRALQRAMGQFLWTGSPNGEGLPVWTPWTNTPGSRTHMVFDADRFAARVEMEEIRTDVSSVLAEMEADSTVSEEEKAFLNRNVLNGRFFSKAIDERFCR